MNLLRAPIRSICWLSVVSVLLALVATSAAAVENKPLHVLLTNDDGYAAPGISAMHKALEAAGHRVTVVAPLEQQSGSSMRVTLGEIEVDQRDDSSWTVGGTPADSVTFALLRVLKNDKPDIVISGINFGQNLGGNTNLSGTVGAALMATQFGVPAIAVSTGLNLSERKAKPQRFPSTMNAFPATAAFALQLLSHLQKTADGKPLLPPHRILNINYPARDASSIKGVAIARVAHAGGFKTIFHDTDTAGRIKVDLIHGDPQDSKIARADTILFDAGYITVSVLDGSLDAGIIETAGLEFDLRTFVERYR